MQDKALRPRATRTVKIGDNHHRLLRILADMLGLSQQQTFELCVETTLTDVLNGEAVSSEPFSDW
ncbi:MAG: hypothetical protein KDB29_13940 [Planctomycetes bacterium]|nr:hypothetical protein [Planctomycetota bacterium]